MKTISDCVAFLDEARNSLYKNDELYIRLNCRARELRNKWKNNEVTTEEIQPELQGIFDQKDKLSREMTDQVTFYSELSTFLLRSMQDVRNGIHRS